MDPQQRMLLERGYAALHAADLTKAMLMGSGTAVNVGQWASEFGPLLARTPAGRSVYAATGFACSVTCGRVSFVLGMQGPCSSYDTACSASLVANHGSMRALQRLECEDALSAGVNMVLDPATMLGNATAGFTSVKGRSHTFDRRADGYARGEAIDAVACGLSDGSVAASSAADMVGSAIRQDGRSASLTAPNGQAQQGVLGASLADALLAPEGVAILEAHGTGTALGDPIEAGAVAAVFLAGGGGVDGPLALGSLKANTGHTEPGAGLAGTLKLLMQLQDGAASPNAQLRALNPHVGSTLRRRAVCILPNRVCQLNASPEHELCGGVSSFGYAGTIAHLELRRDGTGSPEPLSEPSQLGLIFKRHVFSWRDSPAVVTMAPETRALYGISWARIEQHDASPVSNSLRLLLLGCVNGQFDSLQVTTSVQAAVSSHATAVLLDSAVSATPVLAGIAVALALAQTLMRGSPVQSVLLLTSGVQASLLVQASAHAGVWGFARAVRLEQPALRMVSGDIAASAHCLEATQSLCMETQRASRALLQEAEVVWRSTRCVARLRQGVPVRAERPSNLKGGCAVVMGGLGGLGLRAASLLCATGAVSVMLTSRSGRVSDAVLQGQLHAVLTHSSTKVHVVACDANDGASGIEMLHNVPVSGILHAAGLLRDGLLRRMMATALASSLSSKALAAAHLHHATNWPLEILAFFSSWVSTFGTVGQSNYVAANSYLDALAHAHRLVGRSGTALQLPPVSGAGMSASLFENAHVPAAVHKRLQTVGLTMIEYESYLHTALCPVHNGSAQAPLPLNPHQLIQVVPNPSQSLLLDSRAAEELAVATDAKAYRSMRLPLISRQQQRQHIPPRHADVVIVGAGFAGLGLATSLTMGGVKDMAILEKSTAVGGVWSQRSRSVSAPRYQEEILADVIAAVKAHQLEQQIYLEAQVDAVVPQQRNQRGWALSGRSQAQMVFQTESKLLCVSSQLLTSQPLSAPFMGEELFAGDVRLRVDVDAELLTWDRKSAAIVGMNAHGLELMRTGLERGASSVAFLSTQLAMVTPLVLEWLHHLRPWDASMGTHALKGSREVGRMLHNVCTLCGVRLSKQVQYDPGSSLASDAFFLGSYLGLVKAQLGEIKRVESRGLVMQNGHFAAADILIKDVVSDSTTQLLDSLGTTGACAIGLVDHGLWLASDLQHSQPLFNSVVLRFWRDESMSSRLLQAKPPQVKMGYSTMSEWMQGYRHLASVDVAFNGGLREHVDSVQQRLVQVRGVEDYVQANAVEWQSSLQHLEGQAPFTKPPLRYPFEQGVLSVVRQEAAHLLHQTASPPGPAASQAVERVQLVPRASAAEQQARMLDQVLREGERDAVVRWLGSQRRCAADGGRHGLPRSNRARLTAGRPRRRRAVVHAHL